MAYSSGDLANPGNKGPKASEKSGVEGSGEPLDAQNPPSGKAEANRGREGAGKAGEATLSLFGQRF